MTVEIKTPLEVFGPKQVYAHTERLAVIIAEAAGIPTAQLRGLEFRWKLGQPPTLNVEFAAYQKIDGTPFPEIERKTREQIAREIGIATQRAMDRNK